MPSYVKQPSSCSHSGLQTPIRPVLTSIVHEVAGKSLLTTTTHFRKAGPQADAVTQPQNVPTRGGQAECWGLESSREKALSPASCHTFKQDTPQQLYASIDSHKNPLEWFQKLLPLTSALEGLPAVHGGCMALFEPLHLPLPLLWPPLSLCPQFLE